MDRSISATSQDFLTDDDIGGLSKEDPAGRVWCLFKDAEDHQSGSSTILPAWLVISLLFSLSSYYAKQCQCFDQIGSEFRRGVWHVQSC